MSRPDWVARYLGIPWAPGGRGPGHHDCWGLVRAVLADIRGYDLPSLIDGDREQDTAVIARMVREQLPMWRQCQPVEGAVVLLSPGGVPNHVGVMFNERQFLHAARMPGRAITATIGAPRCHVNSVLGFYQWWGADS